MKIIDVTEALGEKFPLYYQEDFDNSGSQILFKDEQLKGVYVCLDVSLETVEDAVRNHCNLIISHHPLIFRPIKNIISDDVRSRIIVRLIESKTSLFSLHTNFDKFAYGYLSEFLGFGKGEVLLKKTLAGEEEIGLGSFVVLKSPLTLQSLLELTKNKLELDTVVYTGDPVHTIKTIAFLNGSGGSSVEKIIDLFNPDCILTGDIGYHHAKFAIDAGVALIDAGHFATEIIFKKLLAMHIEDIFIDRESTGIIISQLETNPFKIYQGANE